MFGSHKTHFAFKIIDGIIYIFKRQKQNNNLLLPTKLYPNSMEARKIKYETINYSKFIILQNFINVGLYGNYKVT